MENMDIIADIPETRNPYKRKVIFEEEARKKKGEAHLSQKEFDYLKRENKVHLYFNMPPSVIGYGPGQLNSPLFNDIRCVCWHCPPVSQDHIKQFSFSVSLEYTSTKLAFGYKLIRDTTTSAFDTRLIPEQIWDEQVQNGCWCGECGVSKLVSQSGWFPYYTWFKFCFGLFSRTNAFGMTDDLTNNILDFLKWRTPEEHDAGMEAIQRRDNNIRAREQTIKRAWELGQNYMSDY